MTYDLAIIGAGILGLGTARELLKRHPDLKVVVLDKEPSIGVHQTGHNSGVIHSGIYYAPGSLKAKLCVQGSREMYAFCAERGIPTDRCGKVIVAVTEDELPRLENLYQRGTANGVQGLEMIGPERLREIEPYCVGVKALWSPNTGIIDYTLVNAAYAEDVRSAGGEILLSREVTRLQMRPDGMVLSTTGGEIEARHVVACAGLYADRLAQLTGGSSEPQIVPFRGDYWMLKPDKRHLARNLIYPVPDPSFPFLGVHFTRRIDDGSVWLGPNAVLAFAREGYERLKVVPDELIEALRYPGFQKLATKYWKTGMAEMVRDFSKMAFLRSLQKYIPSLTAGDLEIGPSGVRAQALAPDGTLVDDFVFDVQGTQVIHVRNAPSPAATSSLAIARLIADKAEEVFSLPATHTAAEGVTA
ncbi:MAG TPA: L-2-hydroxyglutarate oxidase [Chloroflexota bacterium]|nr:L-2-hydroxyglutarate oxidase [Chloroflexota bacterium]